VVAALDAVIRGRRDVRYAAEMAERKEALREATRERAFGQAASAPVVAAVLAAVAG
jgi:hypothetical protein